MSSGFVAAGASTEEKESDAWTKAREKVEATKQQKPARQGEQEGGKSLYEHLQAQKGETTITLVDFRVRLFNMSI